MGDEMNINVKNSNVNYIIILGIFILIIVLIVLLNVVKFNLNGDDKVYILEGSEYKEPGFEAKNIIGKSLNNKVKINNTVNSNNVGQYYIDYNLKYFFVNKVLRREVEVVKDNVEIFDIVLNDYEVIYQDISKKYEEKGAYALNKITGEKYNITNIQGEVNINQVGENEIRYIYEYNNNSKEKTRKVIIYEFGIEKEKDINDTRMLLNVSISGINNLDYVELPNGKKENNSKFSYEMKKSGVHTFKIFTNDGVEIKHEINMDAKGNYNCEGIVNRTGTSLEVKADNGLNAQKYNWNIDGNNIEGSNQYTSSKSVNNAKVTVTMINGLTSEVTCSIKDELVYHFKYDENNLKPKMSCNSYSAQDKIDLDAKLKKVIDDAGYGTRAGVVEAARFLVGNLDYKVPYMGTKVENSDIGRYKKIGLNIGTGGAWGCNIGGYVQGLDCTNFVMWAFYQNGIDTHPYSHGHNDTNSVLSSLRVGDLLFTPCSNDCDPKFKYGLTHVGIIIGVDNNYFYVAEATTGSINATVVSKWDKNNMPRTGKFSQAKIFDYASDGNLTNMWME